jgi:hypothetical protein
MSNELRNRCARGQVVVLPGGRQAQSCRHKTDINRIAGLADITQTIRKRVVFRYFS